jgi:hypothetical protein
MAPFASFIWDSFAPSKAKFFLLVAHSRQDPVQAAVTKRTCSLRTKPAVQSALLPRKMHPTLFLDARSPDSSRPRSGRASSGTLRQEPACHSQRGVGKDVLHLRRPLLLEYLEAPQQPCVSQRSTFVSTASWPCVETMPASGSNECDRLVRLKLTPGFHA